MLKKVFAYFHLGLTPQIVQAFMGWEQDTDRNRIARNSHAAEEPGLTDDLIRETFRSYVQRFSRYI